MRRGMVSRMEGMSDIDNDYIRVRGNERVRYECVNCGSDITVTDHKLLGDELTKHVGPCSKCLTYKLNELRDNADTDPWS